MPAPLPQDPESDLNEPVGLGQRLQKWRGWVAPAAVLVLLVAGPLGSGWISARIGSATHEIVIDQYGLVQQATNIRLEAAQQAAVVGRLAQLPGDDANAVQTWRERFDLAEAGHRSFNASLESLGRRFETPEGWEEIEGCRERVHLMIRAADGATGLLNTLRRVADEGRAVEVAGTVVSLNDVYQAIDSQLESLSQVGTEAAQQNAAGLQRAGQSLVTAWLTTSLAVVVACGAIVYLRVRAEHLGDEQEVVRISQAGDPEADLSGCRVLLAEDGESNQRLMASILSRTGADVEVVGDGKAALDQYFTAEREAAPFDVLLLDLQMPMLDGLGALSKIRSAGYLGAAIALATPAEADSRRACINAGFNDMLQKPVSRDDLVAAVDRARNTRPELQTA